MGMLEELRERRSQRRYDGAEAALYRPTTQTVVAVAASRQQTTVAIAREEDDACLEVHRIRNAEERAAQRLAGLELLGDTSIQYAERRGRLVSQLIEQGRTSDALEVLDIKREVLDASKEVRREFRQETARRCRVLG